METTTTTTKTSASALFKTHDINTFEVRKFALALALIDQAAPQRSILRDSVRLAGDEAIDAVDAMLDAIDAARSAVSMAHGRAATDAFSSALALENLCKNIDSALTIGSAAQDETNED